MKAWLDPIRRELDSLSRPAEFFFRDDDAGWADERLFDLLDLFSDFGLPMDVAVIPMALTTSAARELSRRASACPDCLHLHQHGYQHANHELSGRKCEFGAARNYDSQRSDIERGRERLASLLGLAPDSIFTPPWNRCTAVTGQCLVELGFQILSRDSTALPLHIPGLLEVPVSHDWFAHRKHVRLTRQEWGESLACGIQRQTQVGIMFHHALMDNDERQATAELLDLLAGHALVRCHAMRSLPTFLLDKRYCCTLTGRGNGG